MVIPQLAFIRIDVVATKLFALHLDHLFASRVGTADLTVPVIAAGPPLNELADLLRCSVHARLELLPARLRTH